MTDDLHIWLPVDLSLPWHWRQGEITGMAVDAADRAILAERAAKTVCIIIPGQSVRIFAIDLPKMRETERPLAAGFAVEDKIALPLAEQHVVLSSVEDKRVAIIHQESLSYILEALQTAGIRATSLYADFDIVPAGPDPILLPDRCIYPGPLGYTLDREWAKTDVDEARFPVTSAKAETGSGINLLAGEFAPKSRSIVNVSQFKRLAAILLIACALSLVWQSAQNRAQLKLAEHVRSETTRMYTDFTGQAAPTNPALSVTRAVKSSHQGSADVLALSGILFRAVESVEGVSVETLQFDEAQNQLSLRLRYPQFESATILESAIEALGGTFRAGGIREQGGRLVGDAVVTLGNGA